MNIINTSGDSSGGMQFFSSNFNQIDNNFINTSEGYGIYLSVSGNNSFLNNNITTPNYNILDDDGGPNNTLLYNNSFGQINWTSTNLTTDIPLPGDIILEHNRIGLLPTENALQLNGPAEIEFYGLEYSETPVLLKDGVKCTDCIITSYVAGTLKAEVPSSGIYSTQ